MTFGVVIAAIVAIGLVAAIMISRLEAGTGRITSHHQDKKGTPRGPLEEIKSNASVTENLESLALTGNADEKSESPALSKSAEVSEHDTVAIIPERPSASYGLVYVIYLIGFLGFFGSLFVAVDLKSGAIVGYGFGCMIGCFATGRVLALLEEINDQLYNRRMSESP